jgi:hypothetical protein
MILANQFAGTHIINSTQRFVFPSLSVACMPSEFISIIMVYV